MNRIGYQAMAVGNHEFNFGLEVLERARKQAEFPFLSANILREGTGETAFEPYAIFEQGPIRVGVLGLITPNVPGWEKPGELSRARLRADGHGSTALGPGAARRGELRCGRGPCPHRLRTRPRQR